MKDEEPCSECGLKHTHQLGCSKSATPTYHSMSELIDLWLAKHPNDANSFLLVSDACAGYVRTEKGFVWGGEYFGAKKAEA